MDCSSCNGVIYDKSKEEIIYGSKRYPVEIGDNSVRFLVNGYYVVIKNGMPDHIAFGDLQIYFSQSLICNIDPLVTIIEAPDYKYWGEVKIGSKLLPHGKGIIAVGDKYAFVSARNGSIKLTAMIDFNQFWKITMEFKIIKEFKDLFIQDILSKYWSVNHVSGTFIRYGIMNDPKSIKTLLSTSEAIRDLYGKLSKIDLIYCKNKLDPKFYFKTYRQIIVKDFKRYVFTDSVDNGTIFKIDKDVGPTSNLEDFYLNHRITWKKDEDFYQISTLKNLYDLIGPETSEDLFLDRCLRVLYQCPKTLIFNNHKYSLKNINGGKKS